MNLTIIEHQNQRVLTTAQLAEAYGTDSNTITVNFHRNKERFKEGKHYILLQGTELSDFKRNLTNCNVAPNINKLYLWTEKGAWMHAKSLNTDEAWEAYETLVDDYYIKVSQVNSLKPMSTEDMIILQAQSVKELRNRVDQTEREVDLLKLVVDNEVWLTEPQKQQLKDRVGKRVYELREEDYPGNFQAIYGALKRHFGVSKYDKIPRKNFETAMKFVSGWYPPFKNELDLDVQ